MDTSLLNSSNLNTSFILFENNSKNELLFQLNSEAESSNFFSSKKSTDSSGESTDEDSIKHTELHKSETHKKSKYHLNKRINVRKDLYGNLIQKGGKHKVSFKDNIKGKLLVEMTLIDVKQNSIRGKNYKKYTVNLEAKDKKELSGVCTIF
jgi:hypothetical protein